MCVGGWLLSANSFLEPLCPSTECMNSQIYLPGTVVVMVGEALSGLNGWGAPEKQDPWVLHHKAPPVWQALYKSRVGLVRDRLLLCTMQSKQRPLWAWLLELLTPPLPWANGLAFMYPQIGGQSFLFHLLEPRKWSVALHLGYFLMIWKTTRSQRFFCVVSHSAT